MSSLAITGPSRQLITKLHRWSGLVLLIFLFIAGVTGAVLAFRWEVDALLNPALFNVTPAAKALPQAMIIEGVEKHFPTALVSSITYPQGPQDSLRITLKSKMESHVAHKHVPGMKANVEFNQAFVDPYTGAILGQRNTSDFVINRLNFVPFMLRLHYTLFLEKWGVWFMGGCAVVWFLSSLLGLVLCWPRIWASLKSWKPIVSVRTGQGGYKFNYDLHRAASVITLPVLIVVAFTSIYLNLPNVVKPVVQQFSPITNAMAVKGVGQVGIDQIVLPPEQAAAIALELLPDARIHSVSRDFIKGLYTVRLHLPTDVSPSGNNTIYVGMLDGVTFLGRTAASRTGGDTFIAWQLPLHAGTAFGLTGQILICLAALAMIAMCITGFDVWLRKHRSSKQLAARRGSKLAKQADTADAATNVEPYAAIKN
jgi:uncharacterized iron-regulated membrane protein